MTNSKEIRKAIKGLGYSSRQVTVKGDVYDGFNITVKKVVNINKLKDCINTLNIVYVFNVTDEVKKEMASKFDFSNIPTNQDFKEVIKVGNFSIYSSGDGALYAHLTNGNKSTRIVAPVYNRFGAFFTELGYKMACVTF